MKGYYVEYVTTLEIYADSEDKAVQIADSIFDDGYGDSGLFSRCVTGEFDTEKENAK